MQAYDDGTHEIINAVGNIHQKFYLRSALKYVQILPLLESPAVEYFNFTDEELAVMCASHDSEPIHLKTVRDILTKIGLDETDLKCGPHTPMNICCAFDYIRNGVTPSFESGIYNNCSGKHAGFLAYCKWS